MPPDEAAGDFFDVNITAREKQSHVAVTFANLHSLPGCFLGGS